MKKIVPISVIVDAIDTTIGGWQQFYNMATGEVETVPDPDNADADQAAFEETAKKIESSADYVRLPSREELRGYRIMERFAKEKDNQALFRALRGRDPFRSFREQAGELGMIEEYYSFRAEAYRDVAREWCRDNGIPYTEKEGGADGGITVCLWYTGKEGSARAFAEEMESGGIADEIRGEAGNLRYEYYLPMKDDGSVLLIDSWRDQAALDAHHASDAMRRLSELRNRYDLHMRTERYARIGDADGEFVRK